MNKSAQLADTEQSDREFIAQTQRIASDEIYTGWKFTVSNNPTDTMHIECGARIICRNTLSQKMADAGQIIAIDSAFVRLAIALTSDEDLISSVPIIHFPKRNRTRAFVTVPFLGACVLAIFAGLYVGQLIACYL